MTCKEVMTEYLELILNKELSKNGFKKKFHTKTEILHMKESNKRKYKVRSSDIDGPLRVFAITDKEINNLTENVTKDVNGFTECYKKAKGIRKYLYSTTLNLVYSTIINT